MTKRLAVTPMTSVPQSAAMKAPANRERWYSEPNAISNPVSYAKFYSRSHDAVIRVYDDAGNVIDTLEHTGDFKE